ncbi:hypothetical protein LCGC14_0439450 [marine sediment metagenome]|uniref:Uncharacterized protein n=1 Tax=marine sediment metagenome TaxID=412755 RepID=A0A0F9T445_9ZZZZ
MIKPKPNKKLQRNVRNWARRHQEQVYEALGRFCKDCKATDDLTIHHKEYKTGLEFLEVLCNRCHRSFHEKETRKRLLTYVLEEVEKFEKSDSVEDLKLWLIEKINKIPVKIIPNIILDGFEK